MELLKNLPSDCRQFMMPIRILQKLPKDREYKLLDVGASNKLLKKFLPSNVKYYSLDYCNKHDFIHNLDEFPLPIKSSLFDIIVCLETLEHTLYPHKVMKELVRIAKPNTLFLVSMPNEYNFYCRLNFLLNKKTFVQEPFQVIEKHLHIQNPRVNDIIKFFSTYIKIEQIDYQWYSRTGGHNWNFKGRVSVFIDNIINLIIKVNPSLFARSVIIKGRKIK
jgi:SAM-dependent methyltransferase